MVRHRSTRFIQRTIFTILALILALIYPSAASFAETTTANDTSAGQSQAATPADQPSGEDATTYHYNETTGKWENEHYIWNPATRKTTPKDTLHYSYNPATGKWDTTEWRYNGATKKWEPNTVSVVEPPADDKIVSSPSKPATDPVVTPIHTADTQVTQHTAAPQASALDDKDGLNPAASTSVFDGFYNTAISNKIVSTAVSGDALVSGNLAAGNATTGDATTAANVFNILQSTASFANLTGVNTFVTDIDGDVYGDLFIDPDQLEDLQSANTTADLNSSMKVTIAQHNSITNDLTLDARTGDATVYGNNRGGSAKTGNANAVANLVNLINSSIAANQSFIGTLNINGNLNGDILLPPEMVNTLLASNAPTTTVSLSPADRANLNTSLGSNQSITNNIDATTITGNAAVTGNNKAGSATTGNGSTNITVLNLTGRQIIGDNGLLVFVNVLGKWVGAIINAPTGTTAAALGGGISENTAIAGDITTADNSTITNTIHAKARSGDANVEHNLRGGDATSGDATVSVNVSNVNNSSVSLGSWFGMLFINVFGSWIGSFGVNTDAGGKTPDNSSHNEVSNTTSSSTQGVRAFRFVATATAGISDEAGESIAAQVVAETPEAATAQVLGANTVHNDSVPTIPSKQGTNFNFPAGALSIGAGLFAAERALTRPRHGRQ